MTDRGMRRLRGLMLGVAVLALTGCGDTMMDWDMRSPTSGASTAEAARAATVTRPAPDARGVISYPGYQVVVARRGETVQGVADRLGLDGAELARFNALPPGTSLRQGEVLALPRRVPDGPAATGPRSDTPPPGGIDVSAIASTALDRTDGGTSAPDTRPEPAATAAGPEPIRHQVVRGETAFSIARLYDVSSRSLADWNGLDANMTVREGQYLMIPVAAADAPQRAAAAEPAPEPTRPGGGSPTPTPPSASQPLPTDDPAAAEPPPPPPSPDLADQRTPQAPAAGQLSYPFQGRIIQEFQPGRSDGISLSAAPGTAVRAAADGVVGAITEDTSRQKVLVLRHADNLLTVYANIDTIQVEQGAQVSRGDTIAVVPAGDPAFITFQVRRGFDILDPMEFLR